MRRLRILLAVLSVFSTPIMQGKLYAETIEQPQFYITELQTGGVNNMAQEDGKQEFIELYNAASELFDVTGWRIQYFSATREDVMEPISVPTREIAELSGLVNPMSHILLGYHGYYDAADVEFGEGSTSSSGLLARSGGHIRILNNTGVIIDVIGWGTAKKPAGKAVVEIAPSNSVHRKLDQGLYLNTRNNFTDFEVLKIPSPIGGGMVEPVIEPTEDEEEVLPAPCEGIVITEILPNPDGSDTGREFIELFNPTEKLVYLEACSLQLVGSDKIYHLPAAASLEPGAFMAIYDSESGIVLPNGAGGEIVLRGTMSDFSIIYPANLPANVSWNIIRSGWMNSSQPTPGSENIVPVVQAISVEKIDDELSPCPVGKYRHPETNRCRNIVVAAQLAACAPGQIRNPDTNRCRTVSSAVLSLVPCREGQERNPDTNRCRNIAHTTEVSCADGYERNPDTGRCRKIKSVLAASPSVGGGISESSSRVNTAFLSIMSIIVLLYGAYEYRRDISNALARMNAWRIARTAVK